MIPILTNLFWKDKNGDDIHVGDTVEVYNPERRRETLKALICKQCGGQIDPITYVCKSCDTSYEKPQTTISIVNEDPEYATINTDVDISGLFLSRVCTDDVADIAFKEIRNRIVEAIMPFVGIKIAYNVRDDYMTVRGTVRIKKPNGGTFADGVLLDAIRRYAGLDVQLNKKHLGGNQRKQRSN